TQARFIPTNPAIEKIYPLTPMQEGMLFHHLYDNEKAMYFEQFVLHVRGHLDQGLFEKSMHALMDRHDTLGTVFVYKNLDRPLQVVLNKRLAETAFEDITHLPQKESEAYVEKYAREDRERGFDLIVDPPLRVSVLQTRGEGKPRYKIIWSTHHIIQDGWCIGIVFGDFFTLYRSYLEQKPAELEAVRHYSDHIRWLEKQDRQKAAAFWRDYLEGFEQRSLVPETRRKDGNQAYSPGVYAFTMGNQRTAALEKLAQTNNVTLNILIQCAWGLVLQRYNNTRDVVFGVVVSGRPPEEEGVDQIVGLFVNTLPLRIDTGSEKELSFASLVKRVREKGIDVQKYDYYPLADIQTLSPLKQDLLHHIFAFENYPVNEELQEMDLETHMGFSVEDMDFFEQTNYGFSIGMAPGEDLTVQFKYDERLYDRWFIENLRGHLTTVLDSVTAEPGLDTSAIGILTPEETKRLSYEFSGGEVESPGEQTLHQLVEEQVERSPDSVALAGTGLSAGKKSADDTLFETGSAGHNQLTYAELNRQAGNLARKLQDCGVTADAIVGILCPRSVETIIALLAILKAGGAYLPIEPGTPADRIRFMLEDSSTRALIANSDFENEINFNKKILYLEEELPKGKRNSISPNHPEQKFFGGSGTHLAYVIYTSGSTGRPKGVLVEHRNVVAYLGAFLRRFQINAGDTTLQVTTITFDASVKELFSPLSRGGKMTIPRKSELLDIPQLGAFLLRHRVTVLGGTPLFLKELNGLPEKETANLRYILSGGDVLQADYVDRLVKTGNLHNGYGPTETAVCAAYYHYTGDDGTGASIPIGKPFVNYNIHIMDKRNRLTPVGIPGAIYISGAGVTRGYLNRPELTHEKFLCLRRIESDAASDDTTFYFTGDLGLWLPDGNIRFLGRLDHQVKIRGFRIETGEIESVLVKHEAISKAAVCAIQNERGEPTLAAYYVGNTGDETEVPDQAVLRDYLEVKLPVYMVPTYFIPLDKLPLNTSGKLDRKALPEPGESQTAGTVYRAPADELEERLIGTWQEVLKIEKIGVDDDFFQLGGHSLTAMQLLARLQNEAPGLSINAIFINPTVAGLAQHIRGLEGEGAVYEIHNVEKAITADLGIGAALVRYHVENRNYVVLYVDSLLNRFHQLSSYLKENFAGQLYPHYIRPISEKPERREKEAVITLTAGEFAGLLNLETMEKEEIHGFIARNRPELEAAVEEYNDTVTGGPVTLRYPVSAVQQQHLKREYRYSGTIVEFDDCTDLEILAEALSALVERQGLLRSVLGKEDGSFTWHQHEAPEEIHIPIIDISAYESASRAHILREIILERFKTKIAARNSLLYEVLFIRENLKQGVLVFPADHVVYDAMSGEIIRRNLLEYYRLLEKEQEIPLPTSATYADYVKQRAKGPADIAPGELLSLFQLEHFVRISETIRQNLEKRNTKFGMKHFQYRLPFDPKRGIVEEKAWENAFYLFAGLLKNYLGEKALPVFLYSYGRRYAEETYFDTVGEFLDFVPVVVEAGKELQAMVAPVRERIEAASRYGINFLSLPALATTDEKWRNLSEAAVLKNIEKSGLMISFNFQGKTGELKSDIFSLDNWRDITAEVEKEAKGSDTYIFECSASYSSTALVIEIASTIGIEASEVKGLFDKARDSLGAGARV
ncbi:MAG: amino acid adenylation domain-containing protein, partial [bacterium]|nr:amino acid adenylation domain-containing protein [bacterium]